MPTGFRRLLTLLVLVALGFSGCASEEVATSPGGMMPPAMAGVKGPSAEQIASATSSFPEVAVPGRTASSFGGSSFSR